MNRYCGKCGTAVEVPFTPASPLVSPSMPREQVASSPVGRRRLPRIFFAVPFVGVGLLMFGGLVWRTTVTPPLVATRIESPVLPNVVSDPSFEMARLGVDLSVAAGQNRSAIAQLEGRIVSLQGRQAALASQTKMMVDLRYTLEHTLKQGDELGHWPQRAAGRWFDRPGLQAALRRVNTYVRDQQDLDGRIGEALAKLDRSMGALREQAGRLRDAETSLGFSQRNFSVGGGVSTAELNSVRRIMEGAKAVAAEATKDLPNAATFMLPAFDLDPPRE